MSTGCWMQWDRIRGREEDFTVVGDITEIKTSLRVLLSGASDNLTENRSLQPLATARSTVRRIET